MHFLKEWALGIVIVSVICVIILILSPQGTLYKQVRTAVSLFMLISILQPIFFSKNPDLNSIDYDFYAHDYKVISTEDIIASEVEKELKNQIIASLLAENIEVKRIEIDISVSEANEMKVNRIVLEVEEQYDDEIIKELLYKKSGLYVEVVK